MTDANTTNVSELIQSKLKERELKDRCVKNSICWRCGGDLEVGYPEDGGMDINCLKCDSPKSIFAHNEAYIDLDRPWYKFW